MIQMWLVAVIWGHFEVKNCAVDDRKECETYGDAGFIRC